MTTGAFDLLDRPLVFIPVRWKGIGADENGVAILIDHEVEIRVEMLDDKQFLDWSRLMSADKFRGERNDLNERVALAQVQLAGGSEGVGKILTELQNALDDLNVRAQAESDRVDVESFKAVAREWRKILAGGNRPVFNDDNIARLLQWPGFGKAFGDAYVQTWKREAEIREGNSVGSPANGPAGGPTGGTRKGGTSRSRRSR